MIIPSPDQALTAITVIFHKPIADWTANDRDTILRRLREFMRDPVAFRRSERLRKGKNAMPTVPYDPRQQFDGRTVSIVNAMRGRLPYDGFQHIGGGRYIANDPPAPSRASGIPPAALVSASRAAPPPQPLAPATALWPNHRGG
jgi:hypothetical protein